jgi:HEPN domain-containing protein
MIDCVYQPFKAVSLLAILKHDAAAFWEMSKMFEQMCPSKLNLSLSIDEVFAHCETLDLRVSKMEVEKHGLKKNVSADEVLSFARNLSSVIHSELQTKTFMFIAEDRARYLEGSWLESIGVLFNFPKAERELLAAGRCYAYGEPDASVFHSMRALEPCLESLATRLKVSYSAESWHQVLTAIEKKVQIIGQTKVQGQKMTDEERREKHYYSKITAQFFSLKDGWRNYTMHLRENYNDRDAKDIMENVERVLHYASDRLSENDDEPASLRGETEEDPKRLSRGDEEKA